MWSTSTFAQVDRATLSGFVKDGNGGVLPGATVTVTSVATNAESRQQTGETGNYQISNLIPGQYRVEIELSGFKKSSRVVVVEVGQNARLDVELEVGNFTETVTVVQALPLLASNDATLGAVLTQSQVSNLPLAIRNWDDLLALVPGVEGDRYTEQGGGTSFGRTGGINVHGARALQNNFLLDGVDNNSISENVQELTTQVSRPSVDAIQEFKVVTSPYSAEYGRSPGAAVSVSTKSGTNRFQGTAYEYFRNDAMDSIDYFSQQAKADKPPNKQNQYGGNLGGPILPGKAFFFADFEGTRITRGVTRLTRVPTADDRAGVFASAVNDPLTGQPFANNTIPQNRIDPAAAAILALVPIANQPGANNFFRTADLLDNSDRFLGRFDLKPAVNDSVFGRYIYSNRTRQIPGAFGGIIDGTGTSAFGNQTIKTGAFVAGWNRVVSSRAVNEFRFSWSQAACRASRLTATSGARALAASGRPTSCRSSSTRTSSSSSTACRGCVRTTRSKPASTSWRRCRTSSWTFPPRADRSASARRSPATRWPTICSATSRTCSCRTCGSWSSAIRRRCSTFRTTGRSVRVCR